MHDQILTVGDRGPRLELQLLNRDGRAPDLSGADVHVECRVMSADRRTQAWVTDAVIVNARGGYVAHDWTALETAKPGLLLVQFRRKDEGFERTWPVDRYLTVRVNPSLSPPTLTTVPPPGP